MNKYERFEAQLGIPCLHPDGFRMRGRNSGMCFYGKDSGGGSAPAPDPQIGAAALKNAQVGEDWLNFAKEQFKVGNIRQDEMDALTKSVINQQLSSATNAEKRSDQQWADYQSTYRPIEQMNVLDALGGQYLTDDQVTSLLGKQRESQLGQLQSDYNDRVAQIMALKGANAQSKIDTDALSKIIAGSSQASSAGGYSPKYVLNDGTPIYSDQALYDHFYGGVNEAGTPNFNQFMADVQSGNVSSGTSLMHNLARNKGISTGDLYGFKSYEAKPSGGQSAEQIKASLDSAIASGGLSDSDIQKMLDAEKAAYDSKVANVGSADDMVMASRQASKLAQENAAGEAKAYVMRNSAMARQVGERNMASMGINPNSGRFASMSRLSDMDTGLAAAGEENAARTNVKNQGIALRADQANYGRGGSAVAAQQVGLGLNAGNSAVGNSNTANANWRANVGIMGQGYQGAMQGYANNGNILSNLYGQQLSAWNAQNQANATSAAGLGSLIGTLGGASISKWSDRRLKENIEVVGKDERTGLNLYKFSYVWDEAKKYVGVMSDEVRKVFPEAVVQDKSGYDMVNYDVLGFSMKEC